MNRLRAKARSLSVWVARRLKFAFKLRWRWRVKPFLCGSSLKSKARHFHAGLTDLPHELSDAVQLIDRNSRDRLFCPDVG
jgi:hypothetical protein